MVTWKTKSGTHTNPSEEMDSSNDPTCSLQKLLRRKTKEEPKKLCKSRNAIIFARTQR